MYLSPNLEVRERQKKILTLHSPAKLPEFLHLEAEMLAKQNRVNLLKIKILKVESWLKLHFDDSPPHPQFDEVLKKRDELEDLISR